MIIIENMVKKERSPSKKRASKRICPKCHAAHSKSEVLYDRDELYLIERLDRLRENHNLKVHEITRPIEQDEVYSARIEYLD
jgi:hypothetical protein